MPTYTVVSTSSGPLGPGEVYAGTILVNDGDVFIIDPGLDVGVVFEAAGGTPASFDIDFPSSVVGGFTVQVKSDLTPTVTIADNATLPTVDLDLKDSVSSTIDIGSGASLRNVVGSTNGSDTVTLGNNVTVNDINLANGGSNLTVGSGFTAHNIDTAAGNDTIIFGDNATINDVKMGNGDDSFTSGVGLNANNFDGESGNDTIIIGDNGTTNNIKGGDGDDIIRVGDDFIGASIDGENQNDTYFVGKNANVTNFNGGADNDTVNTESPGETYQNFEVFNVVCFAAGTLIETSKGPVAVEHLKVGDSVATLDRGLQPLRWSGHLTVSTRALEQAPRLHPIRITAGALGPGIPARDLLVSSQHRIMLRSKIVERMFGEPEILVPAVKLLPLPGITRAPPRGDITYVHLLFDRHELILAENTPSESLFLGVQTLLNLDPSETATLSATGSLADQLVRPCVQKNATLERLIERHLKNGKALCAFANTMNVSASD